MGDHADGGGTSFFGQANGLKSDFTQHNEGRFFQDNTIMAATMQKEREEKRNLMRARREERERQRLEAEMNEIAKLKTKLARKNKEKARARLRQVNFSALRIQCVWRACSACSKTQERRTLKAALVLQMLVRVWVARKRRQHLLRLKNDADQKEKERHAAVTIQHLARNRVSNQQIHVKRTKCVMQMQLVVRQFLSLKKAERVQAETKMKEERAVRLHHQFNLSARVIQTYARVIFAKSRLKILQEGRARNCAALILQKMFRTVAGKKTRPAVAAACRP